MSRHGGTRGDPSGRRPAWVTSTRTGTPRRRTMKSTPPSPVRPNRGTRRRRHTAPPPTLPRSRHSCRLPCADEPVAADRDNARRPGRVIANRRADHRAGHPSSPGSRRPPQGISACDLGSSAVPFSFFRGGGRRRGGLLRRLRDPLRGVDAEPLPGRVLAVIRTAIEGGAVALRRVILAVVPHTGTDRRRDIRDAGPASRRDAPPASRIRARGDNGPFSSASPAMTVRFPRSGPTSVRRVRA